MEKLEPTISERPKRKSEDDPILKIKEILEQRQYASQFVVSKLYPEFLQKEKKEFKDELKEGDFSISSNESQFREPNQDSRKLDDKCGEFLGSKSPQEVFERAQNVYAWHLNEGVSVLTVEETIRSYLAAYEVARIFLTKALMEEAAVSCLRTLWRRFQEVKKSENDERISVLARKISGITPYFPEMKSKLALTPEQRGTILMYFLINKFPVLPREREALYRKFIPTRIIKSKGPRRTRDKETIIGLDGIRKAVRSEIFLLLEDQQKEKVLHIADYLESKGILDLEKDADLFDLLTGKDQA